MSRITLTSLTLLLLSTPGCFAVGLNGNLGWLTGNGSDGFSHGVALEAQAQPHPGIILGGGARLLYATNDDDDPHGLFFAKLGYGSWRMPGAQRLEYEAVMLVGGGWLPVDGYAQGAEPAFFFGPRFGLPIRICPRPGPLWRLDRLASIVFYVVPNVSYALAYLPDAGVLRHELAGGVALRFQLYSAVLP